MHPASRKQRRTLYGSTGLAVGPAVVETVRLAMRGLTNQEIAVQRGCALSTVENQLKIFYDVAKHTIDDDAFWNGPARQARRRHALPLIWDLMRPHLVDLVGDVTDAFGPVPPFIADLPAPRCRTFVGRESLIETVCEQMRQAAGPRMILLAAFGGYGKTEAARAIAERMLIEHRFGTVVWIDLNGMDDSNVVPTSSTALSVERVARAVLSRTGCTSEHDLRSHLLRNATLLVLDGLESIHGSGRNTVIERLYRWLGSGPSRSLITSRVDVVAPFIWRPTFPGLELPAAEELLRSEADNTPQVTQLRDAPASVIERIWQLTLGMPLALHQVIGQCQRYELRQVILHLEAAKTLGASDEFYAFLCQPAWQELSRNARALLVYLVLASRAPQSARQLEGILLPGVMIFDEPTVADALAELTDCFLVQRTLPTTFDEELTYTLHPTTRAFINSPTMRQQWQVELLIDEHDVFDAATRQHEVLIDRSIGRPGGDAGRNMTLFSPTVHDRMLARAVPDMLHVVRALLQRGAHERVLWYWESISGYLWYFGRLAEYMECDEYALAAAKALALTNPGKGRRLVGIIYAELGYGAMELDDAEQADRYLHDAERVFEDLGDLAELVRVQRYQADKHLRRGEFAMAESLLRDTLMRLGLIDWRAQLDGDNQRAIMQTPTHNLLGSAYCEQGRYDAARREFMRALRIARRIGGDNRYWTLPAMLNLGRLHEQNGRRKLARHYFERVLKQTDDGGNPDTRADALVQLATLHLHDGDHELALRHAQQAIELYEAMGKVRTANRIDEMFRLNADSRSMTGTMSNKRQPFTV